MTNETTSEYNVKVFISSRCDPKEKFGTFRRALKKLLVETNLCNVFIFEEGASTYSAEDYYLSHIPQSDIVIFFVDNDYEKKNDKEKKSSRDGVLQEYLEAKRQKKKHFFFFCGSERDKTEFQKEVEQDAPKWLKIEEFSVAAEKIYKEIITDILHIYKDYCGGWLKRHNSLQRDESKLIGDKSVVSEASDDLIIDNTSSEATKDAASASTDMKNLDFNYFSQTFAVLAKALKNETTDEFKNDYNEPTQTSDLDMAIAPLLAFVIGHGNKDAIEWDDIKSQVTALHSRTMTDFVEMRLDVIEKYVKCATFDDLRSSLKDIYTYARSKNMPGWLLFDVLIDSRNISPMTADSTGFDDHYWAIQEQFKDIKENYYPAIDRLGAGIYNKCLEEQFKQKTKSLGTQTLGGNLWGMYDLIKIFIIAICNGSLFHMFYTANRLENLLYSYMSKYTNREFFIEYVRVKMISANRPNELESTIRERVGNNFNALEAKSILGSVCNLPEYQSKADAKYKAVKLLWDYFDDETFSRISQWLLERCFSLLKDVQNKRLAQGEDEKLFEAVAAIATRLTNQQRYSILNSVPTTLWSRHSAKWLYKLWIYTISDESLTSDELRNYSEILMAIHDAGAVQINRANYLNIVIQVVLNDKIKAERSSHFKAFVEENYPEVMYDFTNPDLNKRLVLRVDIIEKRGKKPFRSSGDIVPFTEILKIISTIQYHDMPSSLSKQMYSTAVSTIYSEDKCVADNERLTALKILIVLVGRFGYDKEQLNQDTVYFPQTYGDDWPFSTNTQGAIVAGVYLLRATLAAIRPAELLPVFPNIRDDSDVYATIDLIRYWVRFCGKITKPAYIEATLQYVISQLLGSNQSAIRKIAGLMLVELDETKYDKLALDMISQIIDTDIADSEGEIGASFADKSSKEVIISALPRFKKRNSKKVKFILAKGQTDTSWSVRNAANRVNEKLTARRDCV
jgi:uncharacterized damage-inducible protein DinB